MTAVKKSKKWCWFMSIHVEVIVRFMEASLQKENHCVTIVILFTGHISSVSQYGVENGASDRKMFYMRKAQDWPCVKRKIVLRLTFLPEELINLLLTYSS